jgi:hypothetical protein
MEPDGTSANSTGEVSTVGGKVEEFGTRPSASFGHFDRIGRIETAGRSGNRSVSYPPGRKS